MTDQEGRHSHATSPLLRRLQGRQPKNTIACPSGIFRRPIGRVSRGHPPMGRRRCLWINRDLRRRSMRLDLIQEIAANSIGGAYPASQKHKDDPP